MSQVEDLSHVLKRLRLSGLLTTLDLRVNQAVDDGVSHREFLYRLLHDEVEQRDAKQAALRMRRANFEEVKAIEDFDFTFNPSIPKSKIIDLATCTFLAKRENAIFVGKSGTGKSHLAQAIGHRACLAGNSVVYTGASEMFTKLRASRADDSWERVLKRYLAPELLIVDDLGLRPLRHEEPLDLYEIIRRRYTRGAMIITSNRDAEEWGQLFNDKLLASAAMDRLLHHAHIVTLEGDSYRNPPKSHAA